MNSYNHKTIEKKWRAKWAKDKLYRVLNKEPGKDNYYALVEFPYPSGNLHIGHWYAFVVPDMFARYKRMQGFNVLFPIGFDSFGLPAENAAIKHGVDPRKWTYDNIEYMSEQLLSMGAMFDWDRKVVTSDANYYKWTQWLFLKLYGKGLAYRAKAVVNWDPLDKTVLANEQVNPDGTAERSGATVEKRELEQWFFKITDYAEQLIDDLEGLDWPEEIKEAQRNWIGKSEGAIISFELAAQSLKKKESIEIFTTRADTLFGATYIVLAPEHPLIEKLKEKIENWKEADQYIRQSGKKTEIERTAEGKEKTGVRLEGVEAINPATGEAIPIFIADYTLVHYGTGAIMAVPAHDERDFEFAKQFDLPMRQVIAPHFIDGIYNPPRKDKKIVRRRVVQVVVKHWKEDKILVLEWKKQPWKTFVIGGAEDGESFEEAARRELAEETGFRNFKTVRRLGWKMYSEYFAAHKNENRFADLEVFYVELVDGVRDKLSAEEEEKHSLKWVATSEIPSYVAPVTELSEIWAHFTYGEHSYAGEGTLINSGEFNGLASAEAREKITKYVKGKKKTTYRLRDWLISRQRYWGCPIPIVYDPKGKAHPVPEEHLPWLLPEDVDFAPTGKPPLASSKELKERTERIFGKGWYPECDTMDTFVDSSWYFLRYTDSLNKSEFANKKALSAWMPVNRYSGGVEHTTMHALYSRFFYKALYDLKLVHENEPYKVRMNRGLILGNDGRKMSKRWGNVIDPDEQVKSVGADAMRMYLAFVGPYNVVKSYPWDLGGIVGMRRFLERVWQLAKQVTEKKSSLAVETLLHQTVEKVGRDIERFKLNTALSSLMILTTALEKEKPIDRLTYETLLKLLSPIAPYITEELWERLGHESSIHLEPWPIYSQNKIKSKQINITVQVNGKVRGTLVMPTGSSKEEVWQQTKSLSNVSKWFDGKKPSRVVFVPDRLINFVL